MKHFAIIVAAGSGERFAGGVPKALAPIAGVPMLAWSIRRLSELTDGCIVVVPPGEEAAFRTALAEHGAGVSRHGLPEARRGRNLCEMGCKHSPTTRRMC